jgi:Flp pilus assembly protein TadG
MVEFALTAPILALLLFGAIEIGRAANVYLQVLTAARDGSRLGVRGGTDTEIKTLINVETANLPAGAIPTGVACPSAVSSCIGIVRGTTGGASSIATTACSRHNLIVGIPKILPGPWTLCSSTTMRVLIT